MNRKNLNQIFDAYIQQFEMLNDDHNNESYKYNAAMMSEYTLPQRLKSAQDALHPYEKYLD